MKILHVAYSLGESSAATRLAESQTSRHSVCFLLGRPSKFSFVRERQIYVSTLHLVSFVFRVWEKLLCRASGISHGEVFSFGTNSVLQSYILKKTIKKYGIECVHLHWGGVGFMPITAVRGLTVPVVITAHDYHFFTGGCHVPMECSKFDAGCHDCPLTSNRSAQNYIAHNRQRNSEILQFINPIIVAPSSYTKKRINGAHPYARISVVPNTLGSFQTLCGKNSLDMYDLYNAHRTRVDDMKTVVAVGVNESPRQNKGKDILLETISILNGKGIKLKLITIGDYYDVEGVSERTHIDSASSQELMKFYSCADLCLVPSRYETFSQVTLEAIVCATPVVAFDLSGPKDIVNENVTGFLVRSFDACMFAQVVEKALIYKANNKERIAEGAALALKKYSNESVRIMHDEIYMSNSINKLL